MMMMSLWEPRVQRPGCSFKDDKQIQFHTPTSVDGATVKQDSKTAFRLSERTPEAVRGVCLWTQNPG